MFRLPGLEMDTAHTPSGDWEFDFLGLRVVPKVMGLSGPTKSGKTMIAKRLATEYGFYYVNLGSILSKLASAMGVADLSWESLGTLGRALRELRGRDILARLAFRIICRESHPPDKIILDSLLHPAEVAFFERRCSLMLIGVVATREVRVAQLASWNEMEKAEAEAVLSARDKSEQYQTGNRDAFAPCISDCLDMIKNPAYRLEIDEVINARTLYKPIDGIMENLAGEWGLQRQTAPISGNNFPYWNQDIAPGS